jgi:hypothetical protein
MRLITVNENPTARPIHVIPLVVACIKLTNPKKTHTASQPIFKFKSLLVSYHDQTTGREVMMSQFFSPVFHQLRPVFNI